MTEEELKELRQVIREEIASEMSAHLGYDPEPYSVLEGIPEAADAVIGLLKKRGII